jgi:hypothetical protein
MKCFSFVAAKVISIHSIVVCTSNQRARLRAMMIVDACPTIVEVVLTRGEVVSTLEEGAYFGEIALLEENCKRTASIRVCRENGRFSAHHSLITFTTVVIGLHHVH